MDLSKVEYLQSTLETGDKFRDFNLTVCSCNDEMFTELVVLAGVYNLTVDFGFLNKIYDISLSLTGEFSVLQTLL
jgi:hypothetical protein